MIILTFSIILKKDISKNYAMPSIAVQYVIFFGCLMAVHFDEKIIILQHHEHLF